MLVFFRNINKSWNRKIGKLLIKYLHRLSQNNSIVGIHLALNNLFFIACYFWKNTSFNIYYSSDSN